MWLYLQVSRGTGYLQLCLEINPTDACSIVCDAKEDILASYQDCLDLHLQECSSLNSRCVRDTRLMQGLYGMHVAIYGALSTEPTFGDKACLGPTLPCLTYSLKLLTDYNHWTLWCEVAGNRDYSISRTFLKFQSSYPTYLQQE